MKCGNCEDRGYTVTHTQNCEGWEGKTCTCTGEQVQCQCTTITEEEFKKNKEHDMGKLNICTCPGGYKKYYTKPEFENTKRRHCQDCNGEVLPFEPASPIHKHSGTSGTYREVKGSGYAEGFTDGVRFQQAKVEMWEGRWKKLQHKLREYPDVPAEYFTRPNVSLNFVLDLISELEKEP